MFSSMSSSIFEMPLSISSTHLTKAYAPIRMSTFGSLQCVWP